MSETDRPAGTGFGAFDAVYHEYFGYVWKTIGRLGVVPGDIPDAVHDVFVVVYQRWADLSAAAREAEIDRKHLRELIRKYGLAPRHRLADDDAAEG